MPGRKNPGMQLRTFAAQVAHICRGVAPQFHALQAAAARETICNAWPANNF
jgi:hypothetical protein